MSELTIVDLNKVGELSASDLRKVAAGSAVNDAAGQAVDTLGGIFVQLGCYEAWFECYETSKSLYSTK